jgi:hypothetical protein
VSKRLLTMLAGIATLAMLVGGCGGGGDDETTALTKAQFISQADAICQKHNEDTSVKYDTFYKEHEKKAPTKAEVEKLTEQVYMGNLEARLEGLKGLTPPEGEEGQVTAMIDALEAGIKKAKAEDAVPYQTTFDVFQSSNKLSQKYGLTYCIVV